MSLLYLFAYAVGLFYLIVLPVLVFVALARAKDAKRKVESLENELDELRTQRPPFRAAKHQTPHVPREDSAYAQPESAVPKAMPASPGITPPDIPFSAAKPVESAPLIPRPEIKPHVPPPVYAFRQPERPVSQPPEFPPPMISAYAAKSSPEPAPAKDPHLEIKLGAWWATRLGIAFLVVAVVFFGVYVNAHASPWVRLVELVAVAGGLTALGWWLEGKMAVYGRVISAGGLALFYFAAFAAYAIPPVRVVTNLGLGLVLQFGAVAALTAVAWRRNRPGLAMMAIFLGTLSCLFALSHDKIQVTLGAALGLAAAGAFLRVARGWAWPLAFGYGGAQACYFAAVLAATGNVLNFAVVGSKLGHAGGVWPGFTLVYPTAFFVLMLAADIWAQALGRKGARHGRELAVRVAAVAYGLGAWWGGNAMGGDWVQWNLLAAAGGCFIAGVIYYRRQDLPALYEMLFAAAGAWAAVYLILEYAGWVRWSALLAEAFVFVGWARRREAMMAGGGVLVAWSLSGIMAVVAAMHLSQHGPASMWAVERLVFLVWPLASVGLVGWWSRSPRELALWELNAQTFIRIGTALGAVIIGGFAWAGAAQPWLFMGLAVAAAALGAVLRERGGMMTAGAALLAALWTYGQFDGSGDSESWLGLAALTLLVLGGTGWWQYSATEEKRVWATAGEIIYILALLGAWCTGLYEMHLVSVGYVSLVFTLAAGGLAVLAWRGPWRIVADLAWVWALAGLGAGHSIFPDHPAGPWPNQVTDTPWLFVTDTPWLCLALTLALSWLWGALARGKRGVVLLRLENAGMFLPAVLLVLWMLEVLPISMTESNRALVLAGAALAYAVVSRREWLPSGGPTAAVLLAMAWWKAVQLRPLTPADCATPVVVAVLLLAIGWLAWRQLRKTDAGTLMWLLGLGAVAALVVVDAPSTYLPASTGPGATTSFWALTGALVFAAGLAARLRPYRYVGLAGLALCVPRLFIVDITDTLGRIFAFGALAVVLLAIGFSYEKLKPWLVGDDEPPANDVKSSRT